MLTEPFIPRNRAIEGFPLKKTHKKKGKVEVGRSYQCQPLEKSAWKYPFVGQVEKIYENTALVKIILTHEEDDRLVELYNHRVISKIKDMDLFEPK